MVRRLGVVALAVALLVVSRAGEAATITYNSLATYQAATGVTVLDTYESGYENGDVVNNAGFDIHTNAHMSAVLGETDYRTTGFSNWNIVFETSGDSHYCAGCNGSFELTFTSTSVGTASGIFGTGLNFINNGLLYHAFVTFGDSTTADYALAPSANYSGFWGITSDQLINKIHFGLANGGATQSGGFSIDDLRISAASEVPEPASIALLGSGLAVLFLRNRRRA